MVKSSIVIEDARIGFRNFSGEAGRFNPAGRRNFCVFLDQLVEVDREFNEGRSVIKDPKIGPGYYTALGYVLEADGWNVRWLQPKDQGDEPTPYLQVTVSYDNKPPKILLVSKKGKNVLNEDNVNILDWAEIESVDVVLRPYNWEVNGKSGTKAYVKSLYVKIVDDELEDKYREVPDSAADAIGGCGRCEECDGSCGHHGN